MMFNIPFAFVVPFSYKLSSRANLSSTSMNDRSIKLHIEPELIINPKQEVIPRTSKTRPRFALFLMSVIQPDEESEV